MALVAALAILIVILMPPPRPDVILWAEGRDGTFGEMIGAGFDQAVKQHDLTAVEYLQVDSALDPIDGLLARGTPLVVMTGLLLNEDDRVGEMMDRYPETTFVLIDCQGALPEELPPNLTCITSSHAEMGFLAGVASAAATSTGIVGVVVAWDADFMHPFDEGFEQGAHFVDPTIEARSIYLSPIGGDGFVSPGLGWLATAALIRDGADVVFSAAGYSSVGILEGVYDYSMSTGEQAWSIGVDEDQSAVLEEWKDQEWSNGLPLVGWQEHIMTSIVKRLDGAVFEAMNNYFTDGSVGVVELTAGNGGLDYVPSNNLGADAEILEQAKRGLADGSIEIVLDGVDDVSFVRDAVAP